MPAESRYHRAMTIRQLSDTIINQIAAGEVIERPASVVKELVENALDAGASRIEIVTAGGGLSLIRVSDDGSGISESQLKLAVSRHCTSKLSDDLLDIRTLGFRGEALPSIGSVSRLTMRSRAVGASGSYEVRLEGGHMSPVQPAALSKGTFVEVRDLFFNTPARLKFMKGERAESSAVTDVIKRVAIAFPQVRFELSGSDRQALTLPACAEGGEGLKRRIASVMGEDFPDNALELDAAREAVRLTGLVGIPSFNRANALNQFAYVNGRPVRDKLIAASIRAAYADVMSRDRHAITALFIDLEPGLVDVNVHPAKADVRFRDPGLVRGLIIGAIRERLAASGIKPATSGAAAMMGAFNRGFDPGVRTGGPSRSSGYYAAPPQNYDVSQSPFRPFGFGESTQAAFDSVSAPSADLRAAPDEFAPREFPLGAARAQVASTYIVAETGDSLVLIDQHAAHERLVYEELKKALSSDKLPAQLLLIPEIIDLSEEDADRLATQSELLERFGLHLERFGPGAVAVRATPSILGKTNVAALVRDLADELADNDSADGLKSRIDYVAATMACHGSVRAGRQLKPDEMNALLRQMESVPGSGTCNHGRPTFIELKLSDIERLFGRK
jgi:DNA mismatch repair protein MutL